MTRPFTGWHMTTILVAFFGVVMAVNFVMAREAIHTFGGTVVDNSYVAGQRFNGWLDDARAQAREGWSATPTATSNARVEVALARGGVAVTGADITVVANHPLGRLPTQTLTLRPSGTAGVYRATTELPAGRWLLHITVKRGTETARFTDEVRV